MVAASIVICTCTRFAAAGRVAPRWALNVLGPTKGCSFCLGCMFDETGRGVRALHWALEVGEGQGVTFSPGTEVPAVPSTLLETAAD
jgi:hypothetical protein